MIRRLKRLVIAFLTILIIVAGGFTIWAHTPLGPMEEAIKAMRSDAQVVVQTDRWVTFTPTQLAPVTGFIFYPGGRVDPRSYAPPARALAERGFFVVIVRMPFNLAVFGVDKANAVISAHPEVSHWALGGHSLGGAMAAGYLYDRPDTVVESLILWGSYPGSNQSLADRDFRVASIYGSEDGGVAEIEASADRLPEDTVWSLIAGGNHAQFGWYGRQPGDGDASITREEQQLRSVDVTASMLSELVADASR